MLSYTLRQGDEGQEVRRLQAALQLKVDGDFGPKTFAAVKAHQQANGLTVDGIAGPKTLRSLDIEVLDGVDLSDHNTVLDWGDLASAAHFAFVKATQGGSFVAKTFYSKAEQAQRAGIAIVGAYHFATPKLDPIVEADHFLAHYLEARRRGLMTGVPVLDLEDDGARSALELNAWAVTWLEHVAAKTGLCPILYTGWSFLAQYMDGGCAELTQWPLWVARYPGGRPVDPGKIGLWDQWTIWQYAVATGVPGIPQGKRLDCNWVAGGQLERLRA